MSAYIVNNETISIIAKAFFDYGVNFLYEENNQMKMIGRETSRMRYTNDIEKIGQILLDQNYRSVNYLYDEDTPADLFEYKRLPSDAGVQFGCIKCYEYQSCETPDWGGSYIETSLGHLKDAITRRCLSDLGLEETWGYRDE